MDSSVMAILDIFSSIIPALLGAVGAWFLVNEVNHAHQFEDLSRELHEIEQMQTLFHTDPREFWVRSAMISFNCDRAKAIDLASALSNADIQAAIADKKEFWDHKVTAVLTRWNSKTVHSQLIKRRGMLWLGFWLLMASATTQVLFALVKHFS